MMQTPNAFSQVDSSSRVSTRLHYLDWLRVVAILGVFLFHAVHAFDMSDWHIKNDELSLGLTVILAQFSLWGMPFFFLIAGTGTWFALRRRSPRQYIDERFKRLLIPFITGAILLGPLMMYLDWRHNSAKGALSGPFIDFMLDRTPGFSPTWFGALGYHLWYLGFLFSFSLVALPIFLWLRGERGQRFLSWLARLCQRRGGLLILVLPLVVIQLSLRPFFPNEHDWADFFFQLTFFVLGYVLYADERLAQAVRRDGKILLAAALTAMATVGLSFAVGDPFAWSEARATPQYYFVWSMVTANALFWSLLALSIGMRYLDFSNAWLRYGQEAILPFFVLHQPVIMLIAFFVVQWDASLAVKALVVVTGSFLASVGLYELVIRRVAPLRAAFGMKSGGRAERMQVQVG